MQTDASNVTLPGLFANKCFRIPNYQRGYAWGESQQMTCGMISWIFRRTVQHTDHIIQVP